MIRLNGTHDHQLTPDGMEAANADWSPDGNRLAFNNNFCEPACPSDIFTMKPNGKRIVQLTNGFGANGEPNWSPDGRKLLFDHIDDPFVSTNSHVYVMNADGTGRVNLTQSPGIDDLLSDWRAG